MSQVPNEFTNLELLDPEISRGDLVSTMRDWATGLGVRCAHCHVGPDDLVGMDFASDEKATKRTARRMLELARAINGDLMADLPVVEKGRRHQVVSCFTCHRGQAKPPRNIVRELASTAASEGIDAALARYDELRSENFGAGVYDFSEAALAGAAGNLMQAGRPEEAIKVLEKNLEHYPESADTQAMIGMVHLQSGNPEAARQALESALATDSENRMAQRAMQMLEAAPPVAGQPKE
jgi:tetratricopeptide (TPR) repeat protein